MGIQKVFVLQNSNSAPFGKKFIFLFWQIFLSNFNRRATIARFDKVTIQYGGRYLKQENASGISFLLDRSRIHKRINFPLGWVPGHCVYCEFIFEQQRRCFCSCNTFIKGYTQFWWTSVRQSSSVPSGMYLLWENRNCIWMTLSIKEENFTDQAVKDYQQCIWVRRSQLSLTSFISFTTFLQSYYWKRFVRWFVRHVF